MCVGERKARVCMCVCACGCMDDERRKEKTQKTHRAPSMDRSLQFAEPRIMIESSTRRSFVWT